MKINVYKAININDLPLSEIGKRRFALHVCSLRFTLSLN